MLLVSFHGGSAANASNNVAAYATSDGLRRITASALVAQVPLDELRAMVVCDGYLYVANGGKATSNVLVFQQTAPAQFTYVSTFVAATRSGHGKFETAISHPFGIAFDGAGHAYVSNQDTNVVARVAMSKHDKTGRLGKGSQSVYLNDHYADGTFLDGTFAASQIGDLPDVKHHPTSVAPHHGGLGVSCQDGKVQHSVRDVAIARGTLFVCDEPDRRVRMYAVADGTYLGASDPLDSAPTHLIIEQGYLYAVAGAQIYRSPLPSLAFQPIALSTAPPGDTIGGLAFGAGVVYVPFQAGTGGADGGSIYAFTVDGDRFANGALQAQTADTPESTLFIPE